MWRAALSGAQATAARRKSADAKARREAKVHAKRQHGAASTQVLVECRLPDRRTAQPHSRTNSQGAAIDAAGRCARRRGQRVTNARGV